MTRCIDIIGWCKYPVYVCHQRLWLNKSKSALAAALLGLQKEIKYIYTVNEEP